MLDLAYHSLTRVGDEYVVGPVSETPGENYLWHHWVPWMATLCPERFRLRQLNQVLVEGSPFVFPLELRWEFMEWFARGMANNFLTPHVPPKVLQAVRDRKAIILLFFGHEARPLSFKSAADGKETSAYELIFNFVRRHDLPQCGVWFISANLAGRPEYESWKHQRLDAKNAPDPFQTRFVEIFSYLTQAIRRKQEQGFDLTVKRESTTCEGAFYAHQATRLALNPKIQDDIGFGRSSGAKECPPKLFLCMNWRPHDHRRTIVCHLLRRGYLERSLVSFRDDNPDYTHFDNAESEATWQRLQRLQPLTIDCDLPLEFEAYHQGNCAAVKPGSPWPYRDTCFSIVTETHFCNDRLFVSEKLWKPIVNCHPFVVAGTPGTLAYLRSLGFRTFTPMIDERYDSIRDDAQRMQALLAAIDALGALNDKRRLALLEQLQVIVAHNERHLREMRSPMAQLLDEIDATSAAI